MIRTRYVGRQRRESLQFHINTVNSHAMHVQARERWKRYEHISQQTKETEIVTVPGAMSRHPLFLTILYEAFKIHITQTI